MSVTILTTLFVAFASGLSMGLWLERENWESALRNSVTKLNAHEDDAAEPKHVRLIAGALCQIPVVLPQLAKSAGRAGNDNVAPAQPSAAPAHLTAPEKQTLS